MSVGMLQLEQQRAGTAPLKIRDWPLAVRVGDPPTRVAASHAVSSTRMTRQRSPDTRVAQRVTAGVAMGILGFFAGGLAGAGVGAAVDREYGPLSGFLVGGVVGAGAALRSGS